MNIKQIKENKIRMILQFSIPSIIAMLLQMVITITDGYFTGNYVGQNALAAINLGLPGTVFLPWNRTLHWCRLVLLSVAG